MQYGSKRKDFCCYNNQKKEQSNYKRNGSFMGRIFNVSILIRLVVIIAIMSIAADCTFGQYMVQPMQLNPTPRPGNKLTTALQINSFDPNQVLRLELKVTELSQEEDSGWLIFDPDPNSEHDYMKDFDVTKLSSCSDWVSLSRDTVEISPNGQETVEVSIRVPRGVGGFYCAGIVTSLRVVNPDSQVALNIRYLVPVLIEIQGRTLRPKIELKNVGMEFVPQMGDRPATTLVSVRVDNVGPTFSRLKPFARIWNYQDGHWRVITRAEFRDTGIIPGVELNLKTDIMRPLPSGKYKIAGAVYIDGRKGTAIAKELEFVGDPTAERAPTDAPIDLVPEDLEIKTFPGATRSSFMEVINASDETISLQALFGLPQALSQAATTSFKGQDLACSDWLRVEPQKFSLNSFEKKRIRIIAETPETAGKYPWHYAVLGLYAHYPDGQMAGLTTTNVCVGVGDSRSGTVQSEIAVRPGNLLIRDWDPANSQFLVVVDYTNYGEVHFTPLKCRAGLAITSGTMAGAVRASTTLSCDERGVMLPLTNRKYSGIIDLSSVPEGIYRLEANMEYAKDKSVNKQISIQVSLNGEMRLVRTVQSGDEITPNDFIEVQW